MPLLEPITAAIWIALSFVAGALPFSVSIAQLTKKDPPHAGNQNPGATNALKAGSKWIGLLALLLDVSKSAVPVGLAYQVFGLRGPQMAAIALAPALGHSIKDILKTR